MMNNKRLIFLQKLLFTFSVVFASQLMAQGDRYDDRRSDKSNSYDSYDYCREKAADITGYSGRTPSRYRKPIKGALDGAVKGAAAGAALGWITGGDKKDAAKKGAALGLLLGGIAKAKQKEKERKEDRLRQDYQFELEICMDNERQRQRDRR